MTTFEALSSAAMSEFYRGEHLPTFALCDYLEELGDDRGRRLRQRITRVANRQRALAQRMEHFRKCALCKAEIGVRVPSIINGIEMSLRHEIESFVSYLIRLLSVSDKKRVPRPAIGGGYCLVEPGL